MLRISRVCCSNVVNLFKGASLKAGNTLVNRNAFSVINRQDKKFQISSIKSFYKKFSSDVTTSASQSNASSKAVGYWLLGCGGMVFVAVVLGLF